MKRSQLFALIRETMDMITFTDAPIELEVFFEERNGGDGWDHLELDRSHAHDFWHVTSMNTGATVVQSGNPSHVVHDLRALIGRNYDITGIVVTGRGWEGQSHQLLLYPGGDRPLPQRRLPRI